MDSGAEKSFGTQLRCTGGAESAESAAAASGRPHALPGLAMRQDGLRQLPKDLGFQLGQALNLSPYLGAAQGRPQAKQPEMMGQNHGE